MASTKSSENQPNSGIKQVSELEKEIRRFQGKWADGVVAIGKAKNYKEVANKVLDELYDFDKNGNYILFKPTLASKVPVRINREETASYFIGGSIPEDKDGFARTPWKAVYFSRCIQYAVQDSGDVLVMGRCTFYPENEEEHEVATADYTFGYRKDSMRIFLHHSSLVVTQKEQDKCQKKDYI